MYHPPSPPLVFFCGIHSDIESQAERWKELLQGAETAEFIKFAAAPAFARRSQIEESLKKIGWHNMKSLEEFGVSVKPQFAELEAKILPSPRVVFGQGTENSGPKNGRWNLRGKRFYKVRQANPIIQTRAFC